MRILSCDGLTVLSPLSPKIDQHQSSPCSTYALENGVVMRIMDTITQSLTTSPNYYYRKRIGTTNENLSIDITT